MNANLTDGIHVYDFARRWLVDLRNFYGKLANTKLIHAINQWIFQCNGKIQFFRCKIFLENFFNFASNIKMKKERFSTKRIASIRFQATRKQLDKLISPLISVPFVEHWRKQGEEVIYRKYIYPFWKWFIRLRRIRIFINSQEFSLDSFIYWLDKFISPWTVVLCY